MGGARVSALCVCVRVCVGVFVCVCYVCVRASVCVYVLAGLSMYRLRVGQRVSVRANSDWTFVQAEYVGRTGTVVDFTAGGCHATNECYDVLLDGEGTRRFCFCFLDLRAHAA